MSEIRDPEVFQSVLDSLRIGVYVVDRTGTILFWNRGAELITGYPRHETIGHTRRDSIVPQCNEQKCALCGEQCPFSQGRSGKEQQLQVSLRHKSGHPVAVTFRIAPLRDVYGAVNFVVGSFDEPHGQANQDRNRRTPVPVNCIDETTGVANHAFIEFHLRENLAGFAQYHVPFGVLSIAIDHFDHLRSAYGRPATDTMLRIVADGLHNGLRPGDLVGHWGTDQFLAVLPNCGIWGAERAAERLHKLIAGASIHWWGEQITIATSVGYAAAESGDKIESLVERAQRSLRPWPHSRAAGAGGGQAGS